VTAVTGPTIGYHASHEQFPPSELLACVQAAEAAGFAAAMCSDHFAPWGATQGQSGFAWSWLGAAMQATALPFGVVNAPGVRYHPAVIAQAAATLAEMFPGRFWLALGTGQAMNESIVGQHWPPKAERNARLAECVAVIRALWAGETVTHRGRVVVEEATLWTRPPTPPRLYGAALSEATARWVAGWADGLITINQPGEATRRVVEAFREAGGAGKPVALQIHLSWAETDEAAMANALDQWRGPLLPAPVGEELPQPAMFDAAARLVRPEDVAAGVRVSADPARQAAWLAEDLALAPEAVYLHNVGRNQRAFIDAFGASVLPRVRG
jgi:coenzyme F420-dependent glucose-6-phosphate dehydrogenase